MLLFSAVGQLPRFSSGVVLRLASRIQIDWVLLRFLRKISNITILENTSVNHLTHEQDRVNGVKLKDDSILYADLVVDASGRGSRLPQWLAQLEYPPVQEEIIDAKLGYASRFYERNASSPTDFKAVAMTPVPISNPRAVGLWQVEGNRWLVTLIGTAGLHPPIEETAFLEYAKKLSDPVVANTIAQAKPCSDIVAFKGAANRWRRYEKLQRFPNGLLVIGDAFCAFSPFYGQGMTVAAISALAMHEALQKFYSASSPDFVQLQKVYFKKTSMAFKAPWILATGEDLRWPSTTGGSRDMITKSSHFIMDRLLPLSTSSELLVRNFLRISNMVASPISLLDPRILWQLIWYWLRKGV